jgi:hypothetical protein
VLAKVRLGHVTLQDLTKAQLDQLVTDLLANGQRIGIPRYGGVHDGHLCPLAEDVGPIQQAVRELRGPQASRRTRL